MVDNYNTDEKWILDLDDTKEVSPLMLSYINNHCEPISKTLKESKIYAILPSKSGVHIITKPFNLETFRKKYPNIKVHRNNTTNCFIL